MKPIKFRAWHHGGGDPRIKGYMNYSYPFPVLFWKGVEDEVLSVELMQFTGLLDKNGREIFFDDIVIYPNFGFDPANGECPNEIGVIEFHENMITLNKDYISEFEMSDLEIIGNKWENPELLEAK